ncbi:MAG: glycosyltransferase family 9 protein [Bdellovibrio sp.]|nr:glycosyltransferase family 9 protein [Bdellovibrio sp.]
MSQNHNINNLPSEKKTKVLIIQLARFGDILQTCTAVERAQAKNPNSEFYFLGRRKFTNGLKFLLKKLFTEVFELPDSKEFISLEGVDLENFKSFFDHVNSFEFDEAVNLTFSSPASVLTAVINAKIKRGIYRDRKGVQVFSDSWTCYLHSSVLTGAYNLLNLVDLFVGIITGSIAAKSSDASAYISSKAKLVFVHPFASHSKKFWSPDRWSEFFFKLLRDVPDVIIHLLGGPSDKDSSVKILNHPLLKSFSNRIISHVGSIEISEIPDLCKQASLFIGHDSMLGHLISRSNIPSITLALGPVRAEETVPYSPYCLTIYPRTKCHPCTIDHPCDFYQCHYDVMVNSLSGLIRDFFYVPEMFSIKDGWCFSSALSDCNVNIAASNFSGGWAFTSLKNKNPLSFNEVLKIFYRMSFLKVIDDIDVVDKFPTIVPEEIQQYQDYKVTLQKALELITFGELFSNQILTELCSPVPSAKILQPLAQKINEIEGLLLMFTNSRPGLMPLTHYITSSYSSRPDDNILMQANTTMKAFIEGKLLCRVLLELTEAIIDRHAKPQPIMEK